MNLRRHSRAYTIIEMLAVISVIFILLSIGTQGISWLKAQEESTVLSGRLNDIYSGLLIMHQKTNSFPSDSPAHLDQDLAPYVSDPKVFVNPYDTQKGATSLNNSYVTPNPNDPNSYVASFSNTRNSQSAVVLFADGTVETVEKQTVLYNNEPTQTGTTVTGGTITTTQGSTIELSQSLSATIVQSFVSNDGTPFDVIKFPSDASGTVQVTAKNQDVIILASEGGDVTLRQSISDVEITAGTTPTMKVSTWQGEAVVKNAQVTDRGTISSAPSTPSTPPPSFNIDGNHNVSAATECIAEIRVLGKAITYGAGGPPCQVYCGAKIGSGAWTWLFNESQVYGGETYTFHTAAGTPIAIEGRAAYGSWSGGPYTTTSNSPSQVLVLRNGDKPPQLVPYDHQLSIKDIAASVIDQTGTVRIQSNQVLVLFELGTTDSHSSAYDMQDLVVLVTFTPDTSGSIFNLYSDDTLVTTADSLAQITVLGKSATYNGSACTVKVGAKVNSDPWEWLYSGNAVAGGELSTWLLPAGSTVALEGNATSGTWSADYKSNVNATQVLVLRNEDALPAQVPITTHTSISSTLNSTSIPVGRTIWFDSILTASGLGAMQTTVYFRNQSIDFTANGRTYHILVPDSAVIFRPNSNIGELCFSIETHKWLVAQPISGVSGSTFLSGVAFTTPFAITGGVSNVTWSGDMTSDTPGLTISWQWGAATYTSFSTDYNALGVKPVDSSTISQYQNSDRAGTPENYKSSVISGARTTGGTNYTGTFTTTAAVPTSSPDPSASVINPATGKVMIENHQALVLFELTNPNANVSTCDYRDLALVVDFSPAPPGSNMGGNANINPNNSSDFEFTLRKPDGSVITRDNLLNTTPRINYTGPATYIRFKPKGSGNQNTLTLGGQSYSLQNGQLYTIVGTITNVHVYNSKATGAMGKWYISDLAATNAHIYQGEAPETPDSTPPPAPSSSGTGDNGGSVDPPTGPRYTGSVVLVDNLNTKSSGRGLSRGASVPPGWWVIAKKRN